jgi:hypothetical protein
MNADELEHVGFWPRVLVTIIDSALSIDEVR